MKLPTYDELIWPTLVALRQTGGSATNQELLNRVSQIMNFTEEIQSVLHGEGPMTEVNYRLHWARTYLRKVNAIESSQRSIWSITPYGQTLTESDCREIPARVRRLRRQTRLPNNDSSDNGNEEKWKEELLSLLQTMTPAGFERLSQRLLRESGFVTVEVKGKSGDGGIDGVGVLRVNLLSFQVFFQCKRYKESVGASAIRDFRGAMVGRTDKGVLITTGRFSADAKREATRDGAPPIDLIDGEQLCDLLKHLKLGVKTEMVEQITVLADEFSQFEDKQ